MTRHMPAVSSHFRHYMTKTGFLARAAFAFSLLNGVLAAQTEAAPSAVAKAIPPGKAELPEMVTDRPDFTESTAVVGKGVIQTENGLTVERGQGGSNFSGPELLLRVGLAKHLELRVGGDGLLSQPMHGAGRVFGHSDVELAVKIPLFDQARLRPALSLIPILSVPLGSPGFSSGGYDPTLKVVLGKDLPEGFSLGGNANFSSLTTPEGRFLKTAFSASLGHSLGRGFDAFWEIFGFAPWEKAGSPAWIAQTGVARSIGKNSQIDVRVGKRLTESGPGWFWGLGVAFRRRCWAAGRPP